MLKTRKELQHILKTEHEIYVPQNKIRFVKSCILCEPQYYKWKYMKVYRKSEYYFQHRLDNLYYAMMNFFYSRKRNRLQIKLGMDMGINIFKEGLTIYHSQGIVINGDAKVGKNCRLHGANVIGNMGENTKAPIIGDNVRLGMGAKVLGDVYIADDVQIGAGALVIHSCYEKGALLVGVPAKIKIREDAGK